MKIFNSTIALLICTLVFGIFVADATAQIFRRRSCESVCPQPICGNVGCVACCQRRLILPRLGSYRACRPLSCNPCCVCPKDICEGFTCDVEVMGTTYHITRDCNVGCRCPIPNMGRDKETDIRCDTPLIGDEMLIDVDFETMRLAPLTIPMNSKYQISPRNLPSQQGPKKIDVFRSDLGNTMDYWQITIQQRNGPARNCHVTGLDPTNVMATITLQIVGSDKPPCHISVGDVNDRTRGVRNAYFDKWKVTVKHRPDRN